jgi:DNA-binding MarR family transcriptional regulator
MEDEQDWVDRYIAGFLRQYPEIDSEVEGIVDRVCKLNKYLVNTLEDTVSTHGLMHAEYKLLLQLRAEASAQGLSAGELSRALVMSSGGMTNLLDRLEDDGLIRRGSDPSDRRSVLVTLTPKGAKAIDRAVTAEAAREADLLETLTPGERKELNELLRRVMQGFERRLGPPPHRTHQEPSSRAPKG